MLQIEKDDAIAILKAVGIKKADKLPDKLICRRLVKMESLLDAAETRGVDLDVILDDPELSIVVDDILAANEDNETLELLAGDKEAGESVEDNDEDEVQTDEILPDEEDEEDEEDEDDEWTDIDEWTDTPDTPVLADDEEDEEDEEDETKEKPVEKKTTAKKKPKRRGRKETREVLVCKVVVNQTEPISIQDICAKADALYFKQNIQQQSLVTSRVLPVLEFLGLAEVKGNIVTPKQKENQ